MPEFVATMSALRSIRPNLSRCLDLSEIDEMGIPSYLDGNWLSRKAAWGKVRIVLKLANCRTDDVVLDFGCGTGILLALTKGTPKKVYACDINTGAAKLMVEEFGIPNVEFVSPEKLVDLPSGEITKIVAANVLEHVPNVTELARDFARLLAHNGRLIVSGPMENFMYRLGRRIVGFSGDYHVRTVNDIFDDISASECFKVDRRRVFPLPGPMCLYRVASFTPQ